MSASLAVSVNASKGGSGGRRCCCRGVLDLWGRLPLLHPLGMFHCFWDVLVMVLLIYTCMEVPVTLAFNIALTLDHFTGVLSLCIDLMLLTDIVITFRTAYFDVWDQLSLVQSQALICKRYLSGWFWIDFFTSLPFEFMLPPSSTSEIVKMFRILRFIRIIKMLRLIKMMKVFDGFISRFVVREFLIFLKLNGLQLALCGGWLIAINGMIGWHWLWWWLLVHWLRADS